MPGKVENEEASSAPLAGSRVLTLFGGTGVFGHERANLEVMRVVRELGGKVRFVVGRTYGCHHLTSRLTLLGFEWSTAPFGYLLGKSLLGKDFHLALYNIYGWVATSLALRREIRRFRPTHLYVANWRYFFFAYPAIRLCATTLIYRAGDCLPAHTPLHRYFNRRLFSRVRHLVCNSEFVRRQVLQAGAPVEKVRVIYNFPPVRPPPLRDVPRSRPEGVPVLLYVGQVSAHKGVLLLVEAFRTLLASGTNIVLWVAGEAVWTDTTETRLQDFIRANNLAKRIQMLGYVEHVQPLFELADIHVCPSLFDDPSPNVVMESKLGGTPSVVFPRGGLPELVDHKVDGFVCRDCSVEALCEGIRWFLDNPDERRRAGQAARRSLEEKFGAERFVREWASVFRDCSQALPRGRTV